ncbi:RNA repair transcriptional activator RtcR [Uliginosibacterium sp. 31-12]|uniref:RNA repair transcriptional activator RtcR n=1 Tax=Uliginosibacterium sp. 31-12 TaxID=3062781 RepID=UPI0026E1D896|nr:RNA repair transcriptional activator RtcR [Uliginosibacterium sp. 31-12]MDO6386693.1 RNA repair transcriptional activator RtcR [Uliginosibacterium sp. 31-12]
MKKNVVIGFLGTQLDYGGKGSQRWEKWRPTVGLCQQEDLVVHRLELLHDVRSQSLFDRVKGDIAAVSPETEVVSVLTALRDPWDFEEVYTALHDFARGYAFDVEAEDYLIHITTGTHVAQICWFLLAEARYLPARLLQTSPPRKKEVADTIGSYALIDLDLSRYNKIAQRFAREHDDTVSFLKSGIATRNAAFNQMIEQIEKVAGRSKAPMLMVGPTGAGKSFLARRVYELKHQKQRLVGRFVEVNCATLRGDSAMSTLFGHVKGAFTGAQTERPGLLRAADGGLLFLDEIGELGLDEQAMLLKAIEEKRFFPFGADREVESDFQLIAGTHRDLRQWVTEGRFREDLFARINLWTFDLPGLARRPEDIEPNLDFELERFAREHNLQARFNVEARRRYLDFASSPDARWSGNFRELSASITRMATLAEAGRITEQNVQDEVARLRAGWSGSAAQDVVAEVLGDGADTLDLFDRCQLDAVIKACRAASSLSEAGRRIFAVSRQEKKVANDADRLRKYLARFGLAWQSVRANQG